MMHLRWNVICAAILIAVLMVISVLYLYDSYVIVGEEKIVLTSGKHYQYSTIEGWLEDLESINNVEFELLGTTAEIFGPRHPYGYKLYEFVENDLTGKTIIREETLTNSKQEFKMIDELNVTVAGRLVPAKIYTPIVVYVPSIDPESGLVTVEQTDKHSLFLHENLFEVHFDTREEAKQWIYDNIKAEYILGAPRDPLRYLKSTDSD